MRLTTPAVIVTEMWTRGLNGSRESGMRLRSPTANPTVILCGMFATLKTNCRRWAAEKASVTDVVDRSIVRKLGRRSASHPAFREPMK